MQSYKDNFQMYDENAFFSLAIFSVIGDRDEQQDSVGYELRSDEGIVAVCDGMGGHAGGKLASSMAIDLLLKAYNSVYPCQDIHEMLIDTVEAIDKKISLLIDEDGNAMQAGSTIVSVVLKGNALYWISVGDSRIYLLRNGELVQATQDHTYQILLDEQLSTAQISEMEYNIESQKGEGLVSFLGVDGLPKIDSNDNLLTLQKNDRIILMSDGLYKLLADDEIGRILSNFNNIEDALNALEFKVQKAARNKGVKRDNMTLALIRVK